MTEHLKASEAELNALLAEYWKLRHETGALSSRFDPTYRLNLFVRHLYGDTSQQIEYALSSSSEMICCIISLLSLSSFDTTFWTIPFLVLRWRSTKIDTTEVELWSGVSFSERGRSSNIYPFFFTFAVVTTDHLKYVRLQPTMCESVAPRRMKVGYRSKTDPHRLA